MNNAGRMDYCKMINCELESWIKMVELNCIGFLQVTAAVLPHMKNNNSGHIVNITSDAGRKVRKSYLAHWVLHGRLEFSSLVLQT